jgi:hypothetical protein
MSLPDDSPPVRVQRRKPAAKRAFESDEEEEVMREDGPPTPTHVSQSPPQTQSFSPPPPAQDVVENTFSDEDAELLAAVDELEKHLTPPAKGKPKFGERLFCESGDVVKFDEVRAQFEFEIKGVLGESVFSRVNAMSSVLSRRPQRTSSSQAARPDEYLRYIADVLKWDLSELKFSFFPDGHVASLMQKHKIVDHMVETAKGKLQFYDASKHDTVYAPQKLAKTLEHAAAAGDVGEVSVAYKLGDCGRLLAVGSKDTCVYPIYMKGGLRRMLFGQRYHDVDMVNAHVCFVAELNRVCKLGNYPYLNVYYNMREYVLAWLVATENCTREEAKEAMLIAMFGGKVGKLAETVFFKGFQQDLRGLTVAIRHRIKSYDPVGKVLKEMFPRLPSVVDPRGKNHKARDLSYMLMRLESAFALIAMHVVKELRLTCGSLVYDGFMIEKGDGVDIKRLCAAIETEILRKTGFHVSFVEKSMAVKEKDYEWLGHPTLVRELKRYFNGEEVETVNSVPPEFEEDEEEEEEEVPVSGNKRIPAKMMNARGELHFYDEASQKDILHPREKDKDTEALKRIVLQFAQDHRLFRAYHTHTVFKESATRPKLLEVAFKSLVDLVNHAGHDSPFMFGADLDKICKELEDKAFAPGIFPMIRMGNSHELTGFDDFALAPAPERWSFIDGQLDISRLHDDPDGDEPVDVNHFRDFEAPQDVRVKFYRKGVPAEAKHIVYTLKGLNVKWLDICDSIGGQVPNYLRVIMTQVCDRPFDPDKDSDVNALSDEERLSVLIINAVLGRFMMPNNFRDRWELFPFCYGESSVGKGSIINLLRSLLPSELIGDLSGSSRKGLGALQSFVPKDYVFVVEAEKMQELISLGDFKAMASSEHVSVGQLYKGHNADIKWNKQMWFAGQQATALFSEDPAGAALRRVFPMWYRRKHAVTLTSVEKQMINERHEIFAQWVHCYHFILHGLKGRKLLEWDKLPGYFKLGKDKMNERLSIGRRFFGHTLQMEGGFQVRYVPYIMQKEDVGRKGWVAWSDLESDMKSFCNRDPYLAMHKEARNPLMEDWLSEARMHLQELYNRVRDKQVEDYMAIDRVWPRWDFGFIKEKVKYRCCVKHSHPQHGRALLGVDKCGCAATTENRRGSVVAVLNLQRLIDGEIEEWFEKMGIEETC